MSKSQITGMRGVYLAAAELSKAGLVVSTTSRSARGVDLLAVHPSRRQAYSIQVKTDSKGYTFNVGKHAAEDTSASLIYVLVSLRSDQPSYFVIPSLKMKALIQTATRKTGSQWWWVHHKDIMRFKDKWGYFKLPKT